MSMAKFKAQMLWDNIEKGDLSAVHGLLESGNINLEERDENGQTYLMLASEKGELHIVRELLEAGVDPNAVDNDNWSALLCASKEGHLEIVIILLEKNASIEHRDMCGWSPVMWASYKGHCTVVEELLDRGANPNIKAEHNMTCLAWAAGRGHTEVVKALIQKGAKVNASDKYGTTPLIWASRKGFLEIVEVLLADNANVDAAGMNSWTPLLVATRGSYTDVVHTLLEHDPNVNAIDKDGMTALAVAAKEGTAEIVHDLIAKGAYVNVADRAGDTVLIHAVKGGYGEVVRVLLNKYVDVDVAGAEEKTALYWAVEKGHTDIVRQLLGSDPDLELSTKDYDTPLLRAVRSRNEECCKLLLDKGAKVSATDKRGDTALHIAIRARSKRITESLLQNPRNRRLLYRANKSGETPYNMDTYHQRGILTQIFGHRNLNASDAENLLGYEIYSSALADILSEPGLITPITVGLYAKWGSGKSFLLGKLKSEMKSFTMQNVQEPFSFTWVIFLVLFMINAVVGEVLALTVRFEVGLGVGLGLFPLQYGFLAIVSVCSNRYDLNLALRISQALGKKQQTLTLLLKTIFCNRRHQAKSDKQTGTVFCVRFLFSECTRLTSVGGEKSLAAMIATLCEAVEKEYSMLVARLFHVFKPQAERSRRGMFRSVCCIPHFIIVILFLLILAVAVAMVVIFGISNNTPVNAVLISFASVLGLALISNLYTIGQALVAVTVSQKKRVLKAAEQVDILKMDGFMQKLKLEVDIMSAMVNCMDSFTDKQTRLVVIVDGLDSCEQDKVLQVLDTVKSLFADDNSPFITILAVDPHIIIKGIEQNLRSTFHDSNVNGFDYLRNVVHLPFYLQSQGVRVQRQESVGPSSSSYDTAMHSSESPGKPYKQQDSIVSTGGSENKYTRHRSRSKFGSNSLSGSQPYVNSSFDLSHTLVKNDYFSDINPRSMKRLMNIVAVTARLLRAYNIDFNWHRLMAWINIIEQWPYRVSWIIYYFEESETQENSVSLHSIYQKVATKIPASKDVDPLLEIDRNVRKLEAFLVSKSGSTPLLNIGDLKRFLPCTINLDPYLRKLIREMAHNADMQRSDYPISAMYPTLPQPSMASSMSLGLRESDTNTGLGRLFTNKSSLNTLTPQRHPMYGAYGGHVMPYGLMGMQGMMPMQYMPPPFQMGPIPNQFSSSRPPPEVFFHEYSQDIHLSQLSVEKVCCLLQKLEGINQEMLSQYMSSIQDNNICGLVLVSCDMDELGKAMNMKFGDWQLFKTAILSLRDAENMSCEGSTQMQNPIHGSESSVFSTRRDSTSRFDDSGKGKKKAESVSSRSSVAGPSGRSRVSRQNSEESNLRTRFKRNDSIMQQLSYESAILREALEEFTEETLDAGENSETKDEDDTVKFELGSDQDDSDNVKSTEGESLRPEELGCQQYSDSQEFSLVGEFSTSPVDRSREAVKSLQYTTHDSSADNIDGETDDIHVVSHDPHGGVFQSLTSSMERLVKPFVHVLEHSIHERTSPDRIPLVAIPSETSMTSTNVAVLPVTDSFATLSSQIGSQKSETPESLSSHTPTVVPTLFMEDEEYETGASRSGTKSGAKQTPGEHHEGLLPVENIGFVRQESSRISKSISHPASLHPKEDIDKESFV